MNGQVWIEQLNSLHRVTNRTRCTGNTLRIGRGYDNDLVLDDHRVAPAHLLISIGPDGAMTALAASEQPIYLDAERKPLREALIDGDSILRIGHTRLRIRPSDHPVPVQIAMTQPASPAILVAGTLFLLATVLLLALDKWLTEANASPYWRALPDVLPVTFLIFLWAGAWALVSRLLGHRGRYGVHLLIASTGIFTIVMMETALGPLVYGFSLSPPTYLQSFLSSLLGVLVVFTHIGFLGERFQPVRAGYQALSLLVMGITIVANGHIEEEDKGSLPNVVGAYPPSLRLVGAKPLDKTLVELNSLENVVRATLAEPVPEKLR